VRRIVILGAGYAGVRAAQELIGVLDECEVWIVDRSRSHQILTEMYKVAAGGAAPERAQVPLRRLLPRHPHLHVLQGEIAQLEPAARCVRLASGRLAYDLALLGPARRPPARRPGPFATRSPCSTWTPRCASGAAWPGSPGRAAAGS